MVAVGSAFTVTTVAVLVDEHVEAFVTTTVLSFRASDRTLTADEVASFRDQAVASAARLCGATLRG